MIPSSSKIPRKILFTFTVASVLLLSAPAWTQEVEGEGNIELKLQQVLPQINAASVSLRDFLMLLSRQTGVSFIPSPKAMSIKVDLQVTEVTLKQVLEEYLSMYGLWYQVTPTAIKIMAQDEKPPEELILKNRTFIIEYTTVDKIKSAISALKSPEGQIIADPATKQIVVTDTVEALSEMEELIKKLDVQTQTRIFEIKYVEIDEVMKQLEDIISREKGAIQEDARTGKLIITDIPENLARAEQIIAELDVETTMRVFQINFADPDDVLDLIEPLLTKDAYLEHDERTNKIIIDDIPAKLKKVEALIKSLDEPEKVVFIEAEIVDLVLSEQTSVGLDWEIGKAVDITSASDLQILEPLVNIIQGNAQWSYLRPQNFRLALNALQKTGKANVLASPRVMVKNNEGALMNVGSEEPYAVRTNRGYYNEDRWGGGGDTYTQRSKDVGIILDVIVEINNSGYVELDIQLENSSGEFVELAGVSNSGLRVRKTEVKTIVPVKDGRTVVLGGLIQETSNRDVSGVPFLSKVPILGWFFGKLGTTAEKHKLLLFITPHIVSIDDPYRYEMTEITDHPGLLSTEGGEMDLLPLEEPLTEEPYPGWEEQQLEAAFPVEYATGEAILPLTGESQGETLQMAPAGISSMDSPPVVEPKAERPAARQPVTPSGENIPKPPLVEQKLERLEKELNRIDRAREQ